MASEVTAGGGPHVKRDREGNIKIPRALNSFFCFLKAFREHNVAAIRGLQQAAVQTAASSFWDPIKNDELLRKPWEDLAASVEKLHKELYPNYKYKPVKTIDNSKKRMQLGDMKDNTLKRRVNKVRYLPPSLGLINSLLLLEPVQK